MDWWTALTIGILGSFHCIGMCGPIALAIPYRSTTIGSSVGVSLIYNLSRISGYALMGLLFGLLGQGFSLAGLQKSLSVVIGIVILLAVIWPYIVKSSARLTHYWEKLFTPIRKQIGLHLTKMTGTKKINYLSLTSIGILNAFIPCGLVYLAIAGAITQVNVGWGALYMALFGLGTLPIMLGLGISHHMFKPAIRGVIRKASPLIMLFFAAIFILRGLSIDLPVDLQFWIDQGAQPMCH